MAIIEPGAEAPDFVRQGSGVTAGDNIAVGWSLSERELREAEQSIAELELMLRQSINRARA